MSNTSHVDPHLIGILENGFIGLQLIVGLAIVITNSFFIITFLRSAKLRKIFVENEYLLVGCLLFYH